MSEDDRQNSEEESGNEKEISQENQPSQGSESSIAPAPSDQQNWKESVLRLTRNVLESLQKKRF